MFALYPTTVQQFKLQSYKEFSKQGTQVGQHFKNENNKYYAIQCTNVLENKKYKKHNAIQRPITSNRYNAYNTNDHEWPLNVFIHGHSFMFLDQREESLLS